MHFKHLKQYKKKIYTRVGVGFSFLLAVGSSTFAMHPAQSFADSAFTCPQLSSQNFTENHLPIVKLDSHYSQQHSNNHRTVCLYNTSGIYNDSGRRADNVLLIEYPATLQEGDHEPLIRDLDQIKAECKQHHDPANSCVMQSMTINDRQAVATKYDFILHGHEGSTNIYVSHKSDPGYIKLSYTIFHNNPYYPFVSHNEGVPIADLVGIAKVATA